MTTATIQDPVIRGTAGHSLAISGLSVNYHNIRALSGVDLAVPAGSVVTVLGSNGAGKTTLVRAISGLLGYHSGRITDGTVRLSGEDITHDDATARVRRGIGQVMEGRHIFGELTVHENLMTGAYPNRDKEAVAAAYEDAMTLFPILADRRDQAAGYLSGGEQQMLAISRALMASPRLLLLDEPSLGLAPIVVEKIFEVIRTINAAGLTVLLIEQSAELALSISDQAYVLENGSAVLSGPAPDLVDDDRVRAIYLGQQRDRESAPVPRRPPSAPAGDGEPLVSVRDVSLRFGGVQALSGVSFDIFDREILAVIGPNGAGKTSLINCMSGVYTPTGGNIAVRDARPGRWRPGRAVQAGIARTFQHMGLFRNLDLIDNMMLGRHRLMTGGYLAGLLYLGLAKRQESQHRRQVENVVELLDLDEYRGIPVGALPYGIQKRIEFGRTLCMEPRLLLLDEPVAGMNPVESTEFGEYVDRVRVSRDITIMLVEHDMPFVTGLADRIVVLDFGRKIAEGSADQVLHDDAVVTAYLGRSAT